MSISSVTSEGLQLKLRQLLPSQQGFGTDLSASDTIIPIVDLTAAAEGSDVPEFLQTASDSSVTTVLTSSATPVTIISGTGFWQIRVSSTVNLRNAIASSSTIRINNGTSTNDIWTTPQAGGSGTYYGTVVDELYVFVRAGDTVEQLTAGTTDSIRS